MRNVEIRTPALRRRDPGLRQQRRARATSVTPCSAINQVAVRGLGSRASTTAPPVCSTPRMPGELIGKLCAAGNTINAQVVTSSPQISALARTEYR